jgi:hypothetical protein
MIIILFQKNEISLKDVIEIFEIYGINKIMIDPKTYMK